MSRGIECGSLMNRNGRGNDGKQAEVMEEMNEAFGGTRRLIVHCV